MCWQQSLQDRAHFIGISTISASILLLIFVQFLLIACSQTPPENIDSRPLPNTSTIYNDEFNESFECPYIVSIAVATTFLLLIDIPTSMLLLIGTHLRLKYYLIPWLIVMALKMLIYTSVTCNLVFFMSETTSGGNSHNQPPEEPDFTKGNLLLVPDKDSNARIVNINSNFVSNPSYVGFSTYITSLSVSLPAYVLAIYLWVSVLRFYQEIKEYDDRIFTFPTEITSARTVRKFMTEDEFALSKRNLKINARAHTENKYLVKTVAVMNNYVRRHTVAHV